MITVHILILRWQRYYCDDIVFLGYECEITTIWLWYDGDVTARLLRYYYIVLLFRANWKTCTFSICSPILMIIKMVKFKYNDVQFKHILFVLLDLSKLIPSPQSGRRAIILKRIDTKDCRSSMFELLLKQSQILLHRLRTIFDL